jgi:UrcA family protein
MSGKAGILIKAAVVLMAGAWQCAALASGSPAPSAEDVEKTTVRFGDLNLDHPEGAAVLYRRIRHAAQRVCGEPKNPGSWTISPVWRSCVAQSIDRAVIAVDRPALTAYYRVHGTPSDREKSPLVTASSQR